MKKRDFGIFICASVFLAGALVFSSSRSLAVPINEPFTAGAEIVGDVTATNGGDPNFGKIIPPTAGNADYVMDPATGVVTTTGTGSVGASAARQAGTLNLNGPSGQDVLITSSGTPDCTSLLGDAGPVSFSAVTFAGAPTGTIALTGTLQALGVGGTLLVSSSATGFYDCDFNVNIDFTDIIE